MMDNLWLGGEVGEETCRRLGREAARGKLDFVTIGREVGRMEDIRAVWGRMEAAWTVDGENIRKTDGEEEDWGRIQEIIS